MRPGVAARGSLALSVALAAAAPAGAQSLGTFTWQLQPFCNVVTVNVTQQGAVYTIDGYDDQCGAAQRALLVGTATFNPDGTVGLGLSIVTAPGGRPVHVDAHIAVASLSGPWSDSAGNSGTFAFNTNTGGTARPAPVVGVGIPAPFSLLTEGGFVARGTGGSGTIPATGSGVRMMWYPQQAAFRAGAVQGAQWDAANIGFASTALGQDATASGQYSVAAGASVTASGPYSTAFGLSTTASAFAATAIGDGTMATAQDSTALGHGTVASGFASLAAGHSTTAGGFASTALGSNTTQATGNTSLAVGSNAVASGDFSRSLGFNTTASGVSSTAIGVGTQAAAIGSTTMGTFATATTAATGSFVYGDRSTVGSGSGVLTSAAPNQFLVRAAGGVSFFTNAALTSGVQLSAGGSGWSVVSDAHLKENFRDLASEDVLAALATLPVREWNYTTQDAAIRHVGPTAQDFHAAFGLGESDVRINTIDADGVALAAAKALEARTRATNERLTREIAMLRQQLGQQDEAFRARLAHLEQLLVGRK